MYNGGERVSVSQVGNGENIDGIICLERALALSFIFYSLYEREEVIIDIKIIVLGCGGTGGHFLAGLGEFLKSYSSRSNYWNLVLCDGDIVEEHNLKNQAFVASDVGKNKALVMQEGLCEAFGLDMSSIKCYGYIDSVTELLQFCKEDSLNMIVGCVDNHKARQIMHKVFYSLPSCIYIDSGNDYESGQIVTGLRLYGKDYRPPRGFYFPDVLTDKTPTDRELGCGVVNSHSPQHIVTNKKAANILLGFVSWFMQEGFANVTGSLKEVMALAEHCGMTSFRAFPPKDAYEKFSAFEAKCPCREEVMGDEFDY